MATVGTISRLALQANKRGIGLRGKWLAFLTAGLLSLGGHRKRARTWFLRRIDRQSRDDGTVTLPVRVNSKPIKFAMRKGDIDDYRIGGELVCGSYRTPDFTPKTIVDGGANIGAFTLYASACFPGARITAYEPDSGNFALLQRNLAANNVNAESRQVGLWSRDTTIYYHSTTSYAGYVDENPESGVPIPCVLPEISEDCWLKLDIEGSEYEVLPALLAAGKRPRWISMEVHTYGERGRPLIDLMAKSGYVVEGLREGAEPVVISARYQGESDA